MSRSEDTVILQVRVRSSVARFLKARSEHGGMPLTELGGGLLEYAAQAEANEAGEALVLPTVRQVVRQELNLFLERLFDFQVRTYMEAGTARRMVQAVMHYGHDMPVDEIKAVEERQWAATWQASRKHFDGLLEMKRDLGYADGLLMEKDSRLEPPEHTEA